MKNKNSSSKPNTFSAHRGSALGPLLHSEHTVEIEKLVVGGDGLARIPFQDKNVVVFVPYSAPQDKLKIKITSVEKNHLAGTILEILETSTLRKTPECQYFGTCGGCNWQHINLETQLSQKEKMLLDLFAKTFSSKNESLSFELKPTVASKQNLEYRNRIQVKHLGKSVGYFKRSSHEIVDIEACLLAESPVSARIGELRQRLLKREAREVRKYEIRQNSKGLIEDYEIGEDGEGLSFSQVNNGVNAQLIETVVNIAKTAQPQFMTELYAGAGNFSFPLLQALPECAIETAELNAKLTQHAQNESMNFKYHRRHFVFTSACETFVERRELSREFVLLDPPRSGCHSHVIKKLAQAKPKDIVYVSCHPAFLARDLKLFFDQAGEYEIKHLQIFDMFPQTDHFETLVWISRK